VWLYQLSKSGRAEARQATLKFGGVVEMWMLKKESKKTLSYLKLEPVPGKALSLDSGILAKH
jgi:hypothetical protein